MNTKWTDDQLRAIEYRSGSAIVSAAAGSGKTNVMVERIVAILKDEINHVSADSILAVTFTKAAAEELKSRIRRRLMELLKEQTNSDYIRRQLSLVRMAFIGTIDSFCTNLVRSNFSSLDIRPDFSIIDEGTLFRLEEVALQQTLETMYRDDREGMESLCNLFGKSRTDRDTSDIIINLFNFEKKLADPEKWKCNCLDRGIEFTLNAVRETGTSIVDETLENIETACRIISLRDDVNEKYGPLFESELQTASELKKRYSEGDYAGCRKIADSYSASRLPGYRGSEKNISEAAKIRRNRFKDLMKETLSRGPWFRDDEQIEKDESILRRPLISLFTSVNMFRDLLWQMKLSRRELGFDDIERLALQLLQGGKGGPSGIAKSEAAKYSYILIDEYQDTNALQDEIFTLISREGKNMFYVGDVKQSIYAFRNAEPGFFTAKTDYADSHPEELAGISLNRNFRSSRQVINAVNSIFLPVMTRDCGGVDYIGEQLVYGADADMISHRTELCIVPGRDRQVEADYVADRIREMLSSGFPVRDGSGGTRPCQPGDIAVIMRSPSSGAASVIDALSKIGISASGTSRDNLFSCSEVSTLLAVMSVANNPRRDIDVASAAMSPLFSITADTLAKAKVHSRKGWLFADLEQCGEESARTFTETINELRYLGTRKPAGVFARLTADRLNAELLLCAGDNMPSRVANLRAFLHYASTFDSKGTTLSEFCAICRDAKTAGRIKCAPYTGSSNTVTVTSVHGAKGLEWPVVYVTGCDKQFNNRDSLVPPVLFSKNLSPGARVRVSDNNRPYYLKKLPSFYIASKKIRENNISEEMRLFYVALTRARDKLVMTGCKTSPAKSITEAFYESSAYISPGIVNSKNNWMDWALLSLTSQSTDFSAETVNVLNTDSCDIVIVETEAVKPGAGIRHEVFPDPEGLRILNEISGFPGYHIPEIPLRVSVTDLVRNYSSRKVDRPAFALGEISPAEYGSAMHSFMQYADYPRANTDPEAEIKRMTELEFISPLRAKLLKPNEIKRLFSTPVGKEMLDRFESIKREYSFIDTLDARYVDPEAQEGTQVLLQGVADCVIPVENGLILVDYKTDKVSNMQTLSERYRTQIVLYRKALEKLFGQKVIKAVIYSFVLGDSIEIE